MKQHLWFGMLLGIVAFIGSGCAAPEIIPTGPSMASKSGLKPGLTAAQFESRAAIPQGLNLAYRWTSEDEVLEFDFTHFQREDGSTLLDGGLLVDLPEGATREQLETVAAAIDANPRIKGSAANLIKGDKLRMPVKGITDARLQLKELRSIESYRYFPHDCSFTLGECRYRRVEENRRQERILSLLREEGGIWHQLKYAFDPRGGNRTILIEESYATYDKFGLLVALNGWEIAEDGPIIYRARRQ